jgi:transposase InsO family protein
LSYGV